MIKLHLLHQFCMYLWHHEHRPVSGPGRHEDSVMWVPYADIICPFSPTEQALEEIGRSFAFRCI